MYAKLVYLYLHKIKNRLVKNTLEEIKATPVVSYPTK